MKHKTDTLRNLTFCPRRQEFTLSAITLQAFFLFLHDSRYSSASLIKLMMMMSFICSYRNKTDVGGAPLTPHTDTPADTSSIDMYNNDVCKRFMK